MPFQMPMPSSHSIHGQSIRLKKTVDLAGFGQFQTTERRASTRRHSQTNELKPLPSTTIVTFSTLGTWEESFNRTESAAAPTEDKVN